MRISVCLACKNGGEFIKEQIDSILLQLGDYDELIISDDNSTDETCSILQAYSDSRIKIYRNDFNNLVKNFEFVIERAQGDYIFLSDQDDVWLPNKVGVMLANLLESDMVVSNAIVVDKYKKQLFSFFEKSATELNQQASIIKILRSPTSGCCMAFRKSLLKFALPFPKNMYMHDRWLWAIACIYGSPLIIEESLILYRRHENNFTNRDKHDPVLLRKSHANLAKKIELRLNLLSNLSFLFFRNLFL